MTDPGMWHTTDVYYLAAVLSHPSEDPQSTVDPGREVTDEEKLQMEAAGAALARFWPDRVIGDLRESAARFTQLLAETEDMAEDSGEMTRTVHRRLEAALRDWLANLSTFRDHTVKAVRRHFGRPRMLEVRAVFDAVEARNFAFRVALAIRDASLHAGQVINVASLHSRADGAHADYRVDTMDLAHGDDKAKPSMRDSQAPIRLDSLVYWAMDGAERCFVETMLLLREEIMTMTQHAENLGNEVLAGRDGVPQIVVLSAGVDDQLTSLNFLDIPNNYREPFTEVFEQCVAAFALAPEHVAPEDLQ